MIRSELVSRIAEKNPHLHARQVGAVVDTILDAVAAALAKGSRVELRGFGAFTVKKTEARTSRNPGSGASVAVPAKTHVQFRPSKGMRACLNLEKADPEHEAEQLLHSELRSAAAAWPAR